MNLIWSALLNGAIFSACLAAIVWAALLMTPRRLCGAATRYVIWWITLAAVVAAPLFRASIPVLTAKSAAESKAAARSSDAHNGPSTVSAQRLQPVTPPFTLRIPPGPWQTGLLLVWAASSIVLLWRLERSYAAIRRISDSAEELPAGAPWLAAVGLASGSVRVARSARIDSPVAAGLRRPVILIPARLIETFRPSELHHVGMHEAAHILRRDPLALLVQRIVEALFWLHPVVRAIARRIDLEREIACDDLVVTATGNPQEYATCLTRIAELCGEPPAAPAAGFAEYRPHLSQRVELIMKQTRRSLTHSRPALAAFTLALCGLTIVLFNRTSVIALAAPQAPASQVVAVPGARLTALLFETTGMTANDLARATATAIHFVDTTMKDDQRVAVIVSNGRVLVRQDFTTDRARLRDAIRGVATLPVGGTSNGTTRLAGFRKAVQMLGALDGVKALLYFDVGRSLASNDSERNEVNTAALFQSVVVYEVDVRGQQ